MRGDTHMVWRELQPGTGTPLTEMGAGTDWQFNDRGACCYRREAMNHMPCIDIITERNPGVWPVRPECTPRSLHRRGDRSLSGTHLAHRRIQARMNGLTHDDARNLLRAVMLPSNRPVTSAARSRFSSTPSRASHQPGRLTARSINMFCQSLVPHLAPPVPLQRPRVAFKYTGPPGGPA